MLRILVVIATVGVITGVVGLLGLLPVAAQDNGDEATATRSFNLATVEPGGEVVVTITAAGYGSLGAVTETLPAGFTYVSSSLTDEGEVAEIDARTVRFTLQGADKTFTYTVTASSMVGSYSFSGKLRDSDRDDYDVVGDPTVTVVAPEVPQASATRSFNPATVEPGGEVVVMIRAAEYGSLGAVTETLPAGFTYVSSSLTDEGEVTEIDAQTVRFTLQGEDKTFTYTVTASSMVGSYSFSGKLRDSDRDDYDVVGDPTVTVVAPEVPQASATRSFNPATVEPGGEVVVTIRAAEYGSLGAVTETLPAGFTYVSSSLTDEGEVTEIDAQTVRFTLQGEDKTFTYTVTASSTVGSYSFSGKLRDSDRDDDVVGGMSTVTVRRPSPPPARPTPPTNNPPTFPSDPVVLSVAENSPPGTNVGEPVTATDPEGDTLTYTLGGADMTDFEIDSASGQITVGPDTSLDYERKSAYALAVTASDGSGSATTSVIINVTDVDEQGGSVPSATRTFDQQNPNPGDQVKVTIVAQGYGNLGAIAETLPTGFEYDSLETGGVLVDDQGQTVRFALTTPDTVTFTYIVNVLDSATAGNRTFMGTLTGSGNISGTLPDTSITVAAGPDVSGPSATRTFDQQNPNPGDQVKVTIVAQGYGNLGAIAETLPTGFEYDSLETGGVLVDDQGQTVRFALTTPDTVAFTYIVNVLDSATAGNRAFMGTLTGSGNVAGTFPNSSITVGTPSPPPPRPAPPPAVPANNPPIFPSDIVVHHIPENSSPGTNVGEPVTATDSDGDTLTYTLGGADMADFEIDSASGQITVGPDTSLDFETKSMYALAVTASDGNGGSDTASVVVNVTDVDEAPPADSCVNDLGGFAPDRTETLTGTWAAGCASENRLGRYANFFSFTLEEATEVTIELTSAEDTYLYLLEGMGRDGMVLHKNDDIVPATDTNSRIQETLVAGTYTIEATTYSVGQMGSFNLTVSGQGDGTTPTPTPTDDPCRETLPGDDTVTGDWADDCESAVGARGYARYYTFTLAEESEVTITLESDTDPYLYLREGEAKSGDFLHENDDIVLVTDTNSRIQETLAAGTYTIEATTYGFGETGSFTLTVSGLGDVTMPTPPQEPMPTDDPCRETLSGAGASNGMWASACESTTRVGSYARYYTFTLAGASEVTITLESDTDPYLYLRSGEAKAGAFLHENDDIVAGTNTNSQIEETLVAGTYTVEATTYSSGETGSFTLTVSGLGDVTTPTPTPEPMPTDDPCRQTLPGASASNGMWASACESTTRVGSYARYYTFTLTGASEVTITLASDTDPYLYLRSGEAKAGAFLHENDDIVAGTNTNSQIEETLVAGTYTVEATTYSSGETGSFTLTVSGW